MEERMKKSSMKTAPNGSTPPTSAEKTGDMYHGRVGSARGMRLVLVGKVSCGLRHVAQSAPTTSATAKSWDVGCGLWDVHHSKIQQPPF